VPELARGTHWATEMGGGRTLAAATCCHGALGWEDGQSETRGAGEDPHSSISEYPYPRSLYCRLQLDEGFFPLCRWRAQAPLAEVPLAGGRLLRSRRRGQNPARQEGGGGPR
jgi:hypothetical protein